LIAEEPKMSITVEFTTTVLPGHRIEVVAPELPEGRPAKVRVTVEESAPLFEVAVNSDFREAEQRYWQDLPRLLVTQPGRWVAYGPDGLIGEGEDPTTLYRKCFSQGFVAGHFLVTRVEPDLPVADLRQDGLSS
jgi:hypothetical protein